MSDEEIAIGALLDNAHEELKANSINPDALVVLLLGDNEMIIGECHDHDAYLVDGSHASLFQHSDFVSVKNPKSMTRVRGMHRATGQLSVQIQFGSFDFISAGIIEVKPTGAFFLDWLDFGSQLRYCKAYLGFIEGQKKAAAEAAGIILSGSPQPAGPIHRG